MRRPRLWRGRRGLPDLLARYDIQDAFDTKNTATWVYNSRQTVPYNDSGNNVVRNSGTGNSWSASFYRQSYSLNSGQGIQVRFKVDRTDTKAHFSLEANGSPYRRFGVIANGGKIYVQYNDGNGWKYPKTLITPLKTNTWYVLNILVDDAQGFRVEVYEEGQPGNNGNYQRPMTPGQNWRFRHWVYRGKAYLDDFEEFSAFAHSAAYNPLGQPTSREAGNGLVTTWNYYTAAQDNNRLKQIQVGSLLNLQYWYDDAGNIDRIYDQSRAQNNYFTYDHLDRLTDAWTGGGSDGFNFDYSYNQIGNLMSKTGLGSYTYNAPKPPGCTSGTNSVKPHAVQSVGGNSYQYDCNGNMDTRTENGLTYTQNFNAENKLESVSWSGDRDVAPLRYGAACKDNATGSGYLMYSAESIHSRFSAHPPHSSNADHFICVKYSSGSWKYDTNGNYYTFTPRQTDILVASINYSADTITDLKGQNSIQNGIALGYAAGDLTFYADKWNNNFNDGEFYITGSYFRPNGVGDNNSVNFIYDGDGKRLLKQEQNLAAGIVATSNGTLNWPDVVTNGDTWANSGSGSSGQFAYTSSGLKYVQLDLGAVYAVNKIKVWHYARDGRTYHKTKTQVSENGTTWHTVFDSAVSGEYAESADGKTHTFPIRNVRYVRDYLNGSTSNSGNHWVEIEVWGAETTLYINNLYEKQTSNAIEFDGNNDRILIPDSPSNGDFDSQITLEAWIKPDHFNSGSSGGGYSAIVTKGGAYYLNLDKTGHLQFYWYNLSIPGYHKSPNVVPLNQWTYVAATYDGNTVRLYENGVQVYSKAVTGKGRRNSNQVGIGRYPGWATRHFDGRIDEARILNRALSADEIKGDFAAGGRYPARSGAVGWYHLDESSGSTVSDASGSNNGIRYGATWRSNARNTITKYYHFGADRVAMRQGSNVYYLHADHLGTASLTTDSGGAVHHQVRHLPFGGFRWESGGDVSDFDFTGQRLDTSFGLHDYNARYYDSVLGRFISPDSIVPNFANPQSLNRYSYVYNRPLNLNDPSGHCPECIVRFIANLAAFTAYRATSGTYNPPSKHDATIISGGMVAGVRALGVGPVVHSTFDLVTTSEGQVQLYYTDATGAYIDGLFNDDVRKMVTDTGLDGDDIFPLPQESSFMAPQAGFGVSRGYADGIDLASNSEAYGGIGENISGSLGNGLSATGSLAESYNPNRELTETGLPIYVNGDTIRTTSFGGSLGFSLPASAAHYGTQSVAIPFMRFDISENDWLFDFCKWEGLCGR